MTNIFTEKIKKQKKEKQKKTTNKLKQTQKTKNYSTPVHDAWSRRDYKSIRVLEQATRNNLTDPHGPL